MDFRLVQLVRACGELEGGGPNGAQPVQFVHLTQFVQLVRLYDLLGLNERTELIYNKLRLVNRAQLVQVSEPIELIGVLALIQLIERFLALPLRLVWTTEILDISDALNVESQLVQ